MSLATTSRRSRAAFRRVNVIYRSCWVLGIATAYLVLMLRCEAQERPAASGCALTANTRIDSLGSIRRPCTTGDRNLDEGLQISCNLLRRLFRVRAVTVFLDEEESPNAFASRKVHPEVIVAGGGDPDDFPDGTVFLGMKLIRGEYQAGRKYSFMAILGHEYAHIMQYKNHCPHDGMWQELHADFMSGWYLGHLRLGYPKVIKQGFATLVEKGDYHFSSPGHHGTPKQRGAAFEAGFHAGGSAEEAYQRGLDYITTLRGER